jgi:hypothetical protein
MKPKPSWTDKLRASKPPEVKPVPKNFGGMRTGQMMLIPSPKLVDDFIRKIPKGKSVDMATMRAQLAKANRADGSCPLTTGIFLRIVLEAANEAHAAGKVVSDITPVWRVVDHKAAVLKKVSFDPSWILDQRELEGL